MNTSNDANQSGSSSSTLASIIFGIGLRRADCIGSVNFSRSSHSAMKLKFGEIQNTLDVLMLSLSICAVALNAAVIHCALQLVKKNFDTIHVYIISMTAADLLIVLGMVVESLDRLVPLLAHVPCSCLHFLGWMCWTASGLSLVLLNSDKLLFFCFPLHYRIVKSVRRAVKFCAGVWILSFCFVAYVWLSDILIIGPSKFSPRCSSSLNLSRRHIFTFYTLLVCVLPIISSLVVSCYLIRLMRRKSRPGPRLGHPHGIRVSSSANSTGAGVNSELLEFTQAPAFTRKLRSLVFIFSTTLWTAASLVPYRVFVLVQYELLASLLAAKCGWLPVWLSPLGWLLHYLLKMNPIVNPLITVLIYHPYRAQFAKTMHKRMSSTRSHSSGGGSVNL